MIIDDMSGEPRKLVFHTTVGGIFEYALTNRLSLIIPMAAHFPSFQYNLDEDLSSKNVLAELGVALKIYPTGTPPIRYYDYHAKSVLTTYKPPSLRPFVEVGLATLSTIASGKYSANTPIYMIDKTVGGYFTIGFQKTIWRWVDLSLACNTGYYSRVMWPYVFVEQTVLMAGMTVNF